MSKNNKEPLVCQLLRDSMSYEQLYDKHAVEAKPYNGKVSFVYDMIAAKDNDPVACQCRGLVLRENTWEVIAYPFDRFFNYSQGSAAKIDWNTAKFEEKKDGSLCIIYHDKLQNKWMCATRSMCEAHGDINGTGLFSELANRTAIEHGADSLHDLMKNANKNYTYIMELTSPYNQIVCQYDKPSFTLIGVRDLTTFEELDPEEEVEKIGVNRIRTWNFDNLEHLIEVIKEWHPKEHEGIVVKDRYFSRIKVKAPQYLAAAHISESVSASWRGCIELILAGNDDDMLPMLPVLAVERLNKVKPLLAELINETENDYKRLKDENDMKLFAFQANVCRWPAALFAVKRNKAKDVLDFARNVRPDMLVDLLKLRI